jgi:hypothetical protein
LECGTVCTSQSRPFLEVGVTSCSPPNEILLTTVKLFFSVLFDFLPPPFFGFISLNPLISHISHVFVYRPFTNSHTHIPLPLTPVGLESSSNTLASHPLHEPLSTAQNGARTLDDTQHVAPHHHYSINRAVDGERDAQRPNHHFVVSYENSIVNEYSEYRDL